MWTLLEEARRAETLTERLRVLQEIAAYVMQTGPRGGQFYYTPKGRKVYRKLGGASGKSRKLAQLHGRSYHQAWESLRPPQVYPDGARVARALRRIFGDKAPDPKMLGDMYSAEGIESVPKRISVDDDGSVTVSYDVKESNGAKIGYMERQFFEARGGPAVYHDHFAIDEQWQGGGRAGAMLGKALKAYKQLGIKNVSVLAGLDAGPYVWARFGFQSDDWDSANARKTAFRKFLVKQVGLNEDEADKALSRVKDMHSLSGLRIQKQDAEGKWVTHKVGKDFLLHGSSTGEARSWHGEFDMTDPKAVSRWRRQAAKGTAQRKEAVKAGRNTLSLTRDEVLAIQNERAARIRKFKQSYERARAGPMGGGALALARRLGSMPRA